jgi:hypothetical protein
MVTALEIVTLPWRTHNHGERNEGVRDWVKQLAVSTKVSYGLAPYLQSNNRPITMLVIDAKMEK